MQTLRSYHNVGEAGYAQSLLEAAGIPAVLEHEAAASLSPIGVCAVRLQVSQEHLAEAQRILSEHPVNFSHVEDVPRFGFWRGSLCGLIAYAFVIGLLQLAYGSFHFSVKVMIVVWFISGLVGANYRVRKASFDTPKV